MAQPGWFSQASRLAVLTFLVWSLVACGAAPRSDVGTAAPSKPAEASRPPAAATSAPAAAAKPAAAASAGEARDAKAASAPAAAAVAQPAAPPAGAAAQGAPGASSPEAGVGSITTSAAADDKPWDRMIIRNGQISVLVPDVELALTKAREIAQARGGFVSASNTKIEKIGERDRSVGNLTLQVRSDQFDLAVTSLRLLGKVESEVGTSQDVTEEYVDSESTLRSLRATETALLKMLEKAQSLPDTLTLQRELNGVRTQIEKLEGRRRFLSNRSEWSSIQLSIAPLPLPATATPTPAPTAVPTPLPGSEFNPSRTAAIGWNASMAILKSVAEFVILVVSFGWWLIPIGVAVAVVLRRRGPAPTTQE